MRHRSWVVLFATVFAWVCLVALSPGLTVEEPIRKGLEVHEWGVFCVHDDIELANADMRAEWAALPKFVFGQTAGRDLPINQPRYAVVEKPVIFFHTDQPLALEVRVDFSGGMPAVWWPRTAYPSQQLDGCPGDAKKSERFRHLEWHVQLKEPPKGQKSNAQPLAVDKGHWIEALRAVKADDVFTQAGGSGDIEILGRRGGEIVVEPFERERFIYYDGLVPIGKRVSVTVEKDEVFVASRVKHAVLDVTLEFTDVDVKEWPEAGLVTLTKQLKDAGLFEDEAKSLAEVWKKDFFQADGLTLFFRLPQEEYEKLLPMKLRPRPEKLVRVGLVLHPHCEPDFADRVAALAKELDDNEFDTRERAQERLEEMGRAAFVHLRRLREKVKSPEMQRRLDDLLDRRDAAKAINR